MILITGMHRPELTIQAMSEGLYHYMSKPADMEELRIHLDRAIKLKRMTNDYYRIKVTECKEGFIGSSPAMLEVFRLIGIFANQGNPVLIVGETGTGKELVARALHNYSDRRDKKFIPLLMSAIPETLIESELFGHEKGVFTDAKERRIGRFEEAEDGTLFIDEMPDIPIGVQAKLLRIIDGHDYQRIGAKETLRNRARLIFATNVDPKFLLNQEKLREDLFYRLDVCRIDLPPLRDHPEDILELVDYFIGRENMENKRDITSVDNKVLEIWKAHSWPGNVRDLQNTIRRAVSRTRDRIISEPFLKSGDTVNLKYKDSEAPLPNLKELIHQLEQNVINEAYKQADGNLSKAAQLIGLTRRELERRVEKYEITFD